MLIEAPQYKSDKIFDYNQWCLDTLKGELKEDVAQMTLAKFLYHNLGFTVDLMTGGSMVLYPMQIVILNAWFQRNYCMNVFSRGAGKSFLAAMFAALYAIFNPGSKIIITSSNFRTSRRIMETLNTIINNEKASIFKQCFPDEMSRRTDVWSLKCNGGEIIALPLTEGTRGQRAECLICDEFLLLPQEIIEKVLFPFLSAQTDQTFKIKVRNAEDRMIAAGKMKEESRLQFDSQKKMICLSSASYQFEYLYRLYSRWKAKILNEVAAEVGEEGEEPIRNATYFIGQLSYLALPEYAIDKTVIQEAKEGSAAVFKREFEAQFIDDSDSYFSARRMQLCTLKTGESPCIEIKGDEDGEYILAIDPSFSASLSRDHFSMSILKLDRENKKGILVHQYAEAGGALKDRIEYLHYILNNFNIIYVICDRAGGDDFIKSANESVLFKESKTKLDFFEAEFDKEDEESMLKAKKSYNLNERKIVHSQYFSSEWLRKSNEHLQACFDHKRILFASKICPNDLAFESARKIRNPVLYAAERFPKSHSEEAKIIEFLEWQDDWMDMVKRECSMVEVKTTPLGVQSFDLPMAVKKSLSPTRMRKDSYSTLLMGAWAIRKYFEMQELEEKKSDASFIPFFLG